MNPAVQILPWAISRTGPVDDFAQSVFFTGNGHLGLRGFAGYETKRHPQDHALFKAGLFSHITPNITDMVQLPDVLTMVPEGNIPTQIHQELNLKNGVMSQSWETEDFRFCLERVASMDNAGMILVRMTVEALKRGSLNVKVIENAAVANLPVHDDQTIEAKDLVPLLHLEHLDAQQMALHTLAEKEPVHIRWKIVSDLPIQMKTAVEETQVTTNLTAELEAGRVWHIEKHILVAAGTEAPEFPSQAPWAASEAAWERLWADCDMLVEADDPELQGAVRYNIFQLLANNAADDNHVSIGARGLTHGRYKGNTFWDTDIFLLPFYLWARPNAARNLLLYRSNRLEDAKKLAQKQNLVGARFPWMCSLDGMEQCESWDIGFCETHITADVAYAMDRYCTVTGDELFMREHAAPLYLETARYWRSRLTWEESKQQYSSFFVKGPDEYCGATVNNTYTNLMARHNLHLALRSGLANAEETEDLRHMVEHIAVLYDEKRRLYLQDELFERLQIADFDIHSDIPSYKQICFDRMQRYRVLKQADLVLLCTLLPELFTDEEKRNIFTFYEPLTLHDSTLSWGTHAQLALQLGLWDKAAEYLPKAVYLDLKDKMGNTGREGIHMAGVGAAWQALAFGAAGLWADESGLQLHPMLPKNIRRIAFTVFYRSEKYHIDVSHQQTRLEKEG